MSKRACTTSNTPTKKSCTLKRSYAFYCPHGYEKHFDLYKHEHQILWSRIQPVTEFINGDPYEVRDGFDEPVLRYVRDTQTGCTGKKIITENSSAHANYRNCFECAQPVLNTDKKYYFDCDDWTIEPGHNVPCEIGGHNVIRCSNCVCVLR
jgi:hypothetical protein